MIVFSLPPHHTIPPKSKGALHLHFPHHTTVAFAIPPIIARRFAGLFLRAEEDDLPSSEAVLHLLPSGFFEIDA